MCFWGHLRFRQTKRHKKALLYVLVFNYTLILLNRSVTQITATQSIFTLTAGGVDITVTFLSPIEVRLSLRVS